MKRYGIAWIARVTQEWRYKEFDTYRELLDYAQDIGINFNDTGSKIYNYARGSK